MKTTVKQIANILSQVYRARDNYPEFATSFELATRHHGDTLYSFQVEVLGAIISKAKSYHSLQEHSCNFGLTERQEKREQTLEKQIMGLAECLGMKVEFQGDPRGYVVRLICGKTEIGVH